MKKFAIAIVTVVLAVFFHTSVTPAMAATYTYSHEEMMYGNNVLVVYWCSDENPDSCMIGKFDLKGQPIW
jgi:hypothetical protein